MATHQEDYDRDYDTDSISITSTAPTEWSEDTLYDVEEIISEANQLDDEGHDITKYLTKWVDYPLHKCTFEPVEHLAGTTLLDDWARKRVELGEKAFKALANENYFKFKDALTKFNEAKTRRQQKRAKKRAKLKDAGKLPTGNADDDSDSDSDTPLAQRAILRLSHGKKGVASVITPPRQALRRPTPEPASSSLEEEEESGSDISTDSLFQQLRMETSDSERRNPLEVIGRPTRKKNPISSKSTEKSTPQSAGSSSTLMKKKQSISKDKARDGVPKPRQSTSLAEPKTAVLNTGCQNNIANQQTTASSSRRDSRFAETLTPRTVGPSNMDILQANRSMQSMRRSAPIAKPIRMVNEPKTALRAAWNNGGAEDLYTKMHFLRKAVLRGRNEQTPDPTALSFVNAPPTSISQMTAQSNSSPYGRRDTAGLRTVQNNEREESPPASPMSGWAEWEKEKVPLTCFEWRNGSCPHKPEECKFLHRPTDKLSSLDGWVPPKYARPKVTCARYMNGTCYRTAEQCDYAHYNTGFLFNPSGTPKAIDRDLQPSSLQQPDSSTQLDVSGEYVAHPNPHILHKGDLTCYYWWSSPKGCRKPEDLCRFSHRNTGWLFPKEGSRVLQIGEKGQLVPTMPRRQSNAQASLHDEDGDPRPNHATRDRQTYVKPVKLTCYFWNDGRRCTKGDNCKFAHYDTGVVADQPPGRVMRKLSAANTTSYEDYGRPSSASDFVRQPSPATGYSALPHSATSTETGNWIIPSRHGQPTGSSHEPPPVSLSCTNFKELVEDACKLDFMDMFEDDRGNATLDRRAFLLFHPGDHGKELELITRWLLMHHVEVLNFWFDGSWDDFKQKIVDGGTGVIIAHPDFINYSEIPDFGQVLRRQVRVWSIGHQYGIEYDPDISTVEPSFRYDRIEIFPRGGVIYITDEVFEKAPVQALRIVELFFEKIERCRQVSGPVDPSKFVDDGCLLWRLATGPDLMERIYEQCIAHQKEIDAQDPVQSTRVRLYELLHETQYVEQGLSHPHSIRSEDYYPIMSEQKEFLPEYYQALAGSQEEANTWMVELYAALTVDKRREYRQYFVVHTQPSKADWKATCQNIDEIMTPEKCIAYLSQPAAEGNRFQFYEWAFPQKEEASSS